MSKAVDAGEGEGAATEDRIVRAVAAILSEDGYSGLAAGRICERAGVPESAFHLRFADVTAAVSAAHEAVLEEFVERLLRACGAQEEWPLKVKVAIGAALDFAAAAPDEALLLARQPPVELREMRRRGSDARDRLARMLAEGRHYEDSQKGLPILTEQFLVAALFGVLAGRLVADEAERLHELAPQLVQITLTPYLGHAEARRFAIRPRPGPGAAPGQE